MVIDDNPADIALTSETLEESKLRFCILTANDGQQALDQLENKLRLGELLPPFPNDQVVARATLPPRNTVQQTATELLMCVETTTR
jgi:CheY-like chemotaxis protein